MRSRTLRGPVANKMRELMSETLVDSLVFFKQYGFRFFYFFARIIYFYDGLEVLVAPC